MYIKRNRAALILSITLVALPAIFLSSRVQAQQEPTVKLPQITPLSPNAASLWKYTQLPVNMYTGLPSISIPIYEAKSGGITVPVSLSYHAGGIRYDEQASWVGLGWSLNAGGAVNRNIKGKADEKQYAGLFAQTQPLNLQIGDCETELFTNIYNGLKDIEPDEFSFSFPGKSGRFVYQQAVAAPIIMPYEPLKISKTYQPDDLSAFQIVDENGTTFRFGNNKTKTNPVTEKTYGGLGASTEEQYPYPGSWLLTEIESADGSDMVSFNYVNGEAPVQKNSKASSLSITEPYVHSNTVSFGSVFDKNLSYNTTTKYLSEIFFENGKIQFVQSQSYRTDVYEKQRSLEYIKIYSFENGSYQLIKVVKFFYSYFQRKNNAVLGNWKLKLDKIQIQDANGAVLEETSFQYHTTTFSGDNNDPNDPYAQDFWGYYNGKTANTNLIPVFTFNPQATGTPIQVGNADRTINAELMNEGVIKRITYPTGGYTEFEFEPHQYVEDNTTKFAGGLRVKKILTYESGSNSTVLERTYKYGATEQGDGFKNYYNNFGFYTTTSFIQGVGKVTSINSTQSFQLDGFDGTPVVYPYVSEYAGSLTNNLGKTQYVYDNGSPTQDNLIIGYFPYTDLFFRKTNHWRRGLLTQRTIKDKVGNTVSAQSNTYQLYSADEKMIGLALSKKFLGDGGANGTASTYGPCYFDLGNNVDCEDYYTCLKVWQKVYIPFATGAYKLLKSTETTIDQVNPLQSITVETNYTYDPVTLLPKTQWSVNSTNDILTAEFKYPSDFSTQTPYNTMVQRNILSPVIEKVSKKGSTFLQSTLTNYNFWDGTANNWTSTPTSFIVPQTLQTKTGNQANYETRIRYVSYNGIGKLTSVSKENDVKEVYLYGYQSKYPVAKIVNTTYDVAKTYINQGILDNPSDDAVLRNQLNNLRNIPGAFVSTFTYKPLVGVTSQTDPNGKAAFFEYDNFQRLKNVKDFEGNIVKNYQYNYAQSCGPNCSVIKLQTFTGYNTPAYPVGVFSVNKEYIGIASNATEFISLWNSNTNNQSRGTLSSSASGDFQFNFTATENANIPPVVYGLRFYQFDLAHTVLDGVRVFNGAFVDFGDGIRMAIGNDLNVNNLPANTTAFGNNFKYVIHTYPNSNTKTITIFHTEDNSNTVYDNYNNPATSLGLISNLRGALPQYTNSVGGSSYQQASMLTMNAITNWATMKDVKNFILNQGDGVNPCRNLNYAQDFMANNTQLQSIVTTGGGIYHAGYRDANFKISRLKTNWNTYFTNLQQLHISDQHWNREDLSGLTKLNSVMLVAGTTLNTNDIANNAPVAIPSSVIDNLLIQVASGAGQTVSGGTITIISGGTSRTVASDAAANILITKGWTISIL